MTWTRKTVVRRSLGPAHHFQPAIQGVQVSNQKQCGQLIPQRAVSGFCVNLGFGQALLDLVV